MTTAITTISGVSGQHTLEATFAMMESAGSFETTDSVSGVGTYQFVCGSLETIDSVVSSLGLYQFVCGSVETIDSMTGLFLLSAGLVTGKLYQCALTGTTDLILPISSFQARIRSGDPTYLEAVVPNALIYAAGIADRTAGDIIVRQAANVWEDGTIYYAEIARVGFESLQTDQGASAYTARLSGHRTETYSIGASRGLQSVSTVAMQADGKRRVRCAPDFLCRPGVTVTWNDGTDSMTAGMLTLTVSVDQQTMDITEA